MAVQDLPGAGLTPNIGDELVIKQQQELRAEFPNGIAPYTSNNLLAFGFWGGVIGAGLAGAVNLRRANQSRFIPSLLLITFVLVLIYWVVIVGVNDRINLSAQQIDLSSLTAMDAVVYIVISLIFAGWIGARQRPMSRRWADLVGKPSRGDQGGCVSMIAMVIASSFIGAALVFALSTLFLPTTLQVIYPQQNYTAQGITVSVPAGWGAIAPEKLGMDCNASGLTCLAVVSERVTGSVARFLITSGGTPFLVLNQVAFQLLTQYPGLPAMVPQPYTPASLTGRNADMITVSVNGNRVLGTAIADGGKVITFLLTCTNALVPTCETVRDQLVSSMQFSPQPAATPEALPLR